MQAFSLRWLDRPVNNNILNVTLM